jgi:hypothetical protein
MVFYKLFKTSLPENQKLEQMFSVLKSENYVMYNTYYEKKLKLSSTELFRDHYSNFKPVLDELNKVGADNLDSFKLNSIGEIACFFRSDCNSLFNYPYNKSLRHSFYKTLEPSFPEIFGIDDYNSSIQKLSTQPVHCLNKASEYYNTVEISVIRDTIESSIGFLSDLTQHPDYNTIVNIIAQNLSKFSEEDLESLTYFVINHEKLALVTLEPYLISVLGLTYFFKFFYPLHSTEAFKILIKSAVSKQILLRDCLHRRISLYCNKCLKLYSSIEPLINKITNFPLLKYGGSLSFGTTFSLSVWKLLTKKAMVIVDKPKSTVISDVIERELAIGSGLDNYYINTFTETVSKLSFDSGRFIGTVMPNFWRGVMSNNANLIKSAGTLVDDQINKMAEVKELKEKKSKN